MEKRPYDLGRRTIQFAHGVREFIGTLPKTFIVFEDCKQLLRSSGSVAANSIEAEQALSKKDFAMHLKISRKEAKESHLWLELLSPNIPQAYRKMAAKLQDEALQLTRIFQSSIRTTGFDHLHT